MTVLGIEFWIAPQLSALDNTILIPYSTRKLFPPLKRGLGGLSKLIENLKMGSVVKLNFFQVTDLKS